MIFLCKRAVRLLYFILAGRLADTEALQKAFYPIAEKIYNAQAAQNGAGADTGAQGADGNYYDAGFEDKTNG